MLDGENNIELKTVCDLLGMNFFIRSYQRGYRWTQRQVEDLLNDINNFEQKNESWYCLQPLVVKKTLLDISQFKKDIQDKTELQDIRDALNKQIRYEVIDGQQRLTTIYLILSFLQVENKYKLEYETRKESRIFLKQIAEKDENAVQENIDFFFLDEAYKTIRTSEIFTSESDTKCFKDRLMNHVKFIWYEVDKNEDSISVFTRMNMGKIHLTNAELIKALFLNRSNFDLNVEEKLRLRQYEIASEWDTIEYTLQNNEFWLFLNKPGDQKATRIDFIFDLICDKDELGIGKEGTGTDEYRTFRYFDKYFRSKPNISECWGIVKKYFQIFSEWYNNLELYHYVGYLVERGETIHSLLEIWTTTKNEFMSTIEKKIKGTLKYCGDLDTEYETSNMPKTKCCPLLLLHNVQTVINQNKQMKDDKYGLAIFYRFPFHLYKLERWDVEHIDSNTENDLSDIKEQKEWLRCALLAVIDETLKDEIRNFIAKEENSNGKNNQDEDFSNLWMKLINNTGDYKNRLSDAEKNFVWNFTLLDAHTNRSYGNAIFSAKRRAIIGKDQGKRYQIDENLEIKETNAEIAFIPPVTKNIFSKYYNPNDNNLKEWNKTDAEAYKNNILETLGKFGVIASKSNGKGNNNE